MKHRNFHPNILLLYYYIRTELLNLELFASMKVELSGLLVLLTMWLTRTLLPSFLKLVIQVQKDIPVHPNSLSKAFFLCLSVHRHFIRHPSKKWKNSLLSLFIMDSVGAFVASGRDYYSSPSSSWILQENLLLPIEITPARVSGYTCVKNLKWNASNNQSSLVR